MQHRNRRIIVILIILALAGGAIGWALKRNGGAAASFRTAKVSRGDLQVSISATGTVEPEEVIDVGAQVAGRILAFGKDVDGRSVDYGSMVKEGTVLAQIDDSLYSAEAAQAEARVNNAKAGLQRAEADLEQLQAKLYQAERDWQRAQAIGPSEALAPASFDNYRSTYETAKANVAVGEAAIQQAKAGQAEAEAAALSARRNLGYTTIKSPVDGVVIDRRVNIGQTVVASLNAPSLFLIAKDLKQIQVWVAVNEADIGKIHPGQPVTFTVDAFPGEIFHGEVGKIRLNAAMTQNVVTYTVEIVTGNENGRLLPYLTANVRFALEEAKDVLLVPNAALRWQPALEQIAPAFRQQVEAETASEEGGEAGRPAAPESERRVERLWALENGYVKPLPVQKGLTDGLVTQVEGEGVAEGLAVVTGVQMPEGDASAPAGNPFVPQFRRGGSRNSGSR